MIGIIGAMEEEVAGLKARMRDVKRSERAGMSFYQGQIEGKDCVVVCSGIGKVNAAACAQILSDCYAVDCIMNTGIAGGVQKDINIGDIVLSVDAVQHDFDCTGFGYPMGKIPRMETSVFRADEKLLALAESCCSEVNPDTVSYTHLDVYKRQRSDDEALNEHRESRNLCGGCDGCSSETRLLTQRIVRHDTDKVQSFPDCKQLGECRAEILPL